jgi:hypothetical protein
LSALRPFILREKEGKTAAGLALDDSGIHFEFGGRTRASPRRVDPHCVVKAGTMFVKSCYAPFLSPSGQCVCGKYAKAPRRRVA